MQPHGVVVGKGFDDNKLFDIYMSFLEQASFDWHWQRPYYAEYQIPLLISNGILVNLASSFDLI